MFNEFILQIFGGCVTPTDYIVTFLFFYMLLDFFIEIIGRLLSFGRR